MNPTEPAIQDVRHREGCVNLRIVVPDSLFYLQGHFPGFAVLPGVVQLDWAIRYARRYLPVGDAPAKTVQVKFRKPIPPNRPIELSLVYLGERKRLSFECRDDAGLYSSGQIVFDEP